MTALRYHPRFAHIVVDDSSQPAVTCETQESKAISFSAPRFSTGG